MTATAAAVRSRVGVIDLVFADSAPDLAVHVRTISWISAIAFASAHGAVDEYRYFPTDMPPSERIKPNVFDVLALGSRQQSSLASGRYLSTACADIMQNGSFAAYRRLDLRADSLEESVRDASTRPAHEFAVARISKESPLEITLMIGMAANSVLAMVNFLWMVRLLRKGMRQFGIDELDHDIETLTRLIKREELRGRLKELEEAAERNPDAFPIPIASARGRIED